MPHLTYQLKCTMCHLGVQTSLIIIHHMSKLVMSQNIVPHLPWKSLEVLEVTCCFFEQVHEIIQRDFQHNDVY